MPVLLHWHNPMFWEAIFLKKSNKKLILPIGIVFVLVMILCIGAVFGYFVYGSTLIDVTNNKSLNSHLAHDKNQSINILVTNEYEGYFAVLYTDPSDLPDTLFHLQVLEKNKYYDNKYSESAALSKLQNSSQEVSLLHVNFAESEHAVCFIADNENNVTKCSLFEFDPYTLQAIKKLDEIDVPQTDYIIIKEYELEHEENTVFAFDGSKDMNEIREIFG